MEFRLRRGVRFHDGEEMTAEEVAFSHDDPGYVLLNQSVLRYGKQRDIGWRPSPTQAMDFRRENLSFGPR